MLWCDIFIVVLAGDKVMRRHEDFELQGKLSDFLDKMGIFKCRVEILLEKFIKVGDDGTIVERDADFTGNLRW